MNLRWDHMEEATCEHDGWEFGCAPNSDHLENHLCGPVGYCSKVWTHRCDWHPDHFMPPLQTNKAAIGPGLRLTEGFHHNSKAIIIHTS